MTNANTTWVEFELVGKFYTAKYRTNANASIVQFWSVEKNGWKITKSATVQLHAIRELKKANAWQHNAPFNPQFLGAQRPQACQDY
jgi:hypothetical protein